jgi:hypothetical protein
MWSPRSTIVLGRGDVASQHAVARFSAVLFPGQMQVISVPYALGEQQWVLRVPVALTTGSKLPG